MTPSARRRLSRPLRSAVLGLSALLLPALTWLWCWPLPDLFNTPRSTVLLDRKGGLLGASVAADGQWRFPPSDSVPARFATCLTQFEDRHFRSHHGIHLPSLVRAYMQNRRAGRVVSGGSTLTMQVARMGLGDRERTYANKVTEALLALRIDLRLGKDSVLALYCANAPFGGNVVGLEAAAWRYYGRPPAQLSWAECATLAVLPNAPATIHPGRAPNALRAKRDRLLDRLLTVGAIDTLEWSLARQEPLPQRPMPLPARAPHLLATLRRMGHEGRLVRTTLDGDLQDLATRALSAQAPVLEANEVHNAAAIVLDVPTGEVLAYVGNLPEAGAEHAGQMDLVRAQRSTGSLLKPFLYADMLATGELLPHMLVADVPTRYEGFAPLNFDGSYAGALPASEALARSLNIPAVRALRQHGVERTLRLLRAMGLNGLDRSADHYGLSLIMGGGECDLWSLTGAYASMARIVENAGRNNPGGDVHEPVVLQAPTAIISAEAREGAPLPAAAVHFTLEALRNVKRPEGEAGWDVFQGAHRVAWKTGTSVGHRDGWAIGVTAQHAVGVWTGNADGEGRPGLTGTLAAAPLLFDLYGRLPPGTATAVPHDGLVNAPLCRWSGHRAGPDCPAVDTVAIPPAGVRTPPCPYHRSIRVDPTGRWRVGPEQDGRNVAWAVLPPGMEHYLAQRDPSFRPIPPRRDGGDEHQPMEVLYPDAGARLLLPIQLDGERGRTVVRVAHRDADAVIDWDLDGSYLGRTSGDHHLALAPAEGPHLLTLTDDHGHQLRHRFSVRSAPAAAP